MSEDRIELMDLFRRDMTGIEPTRAWPEDQHPHPALKNQPKVFKFDQSTYLFKVWLAGREALAAQRDEGLAREAELKKELAQFQNGYTEQWQSREALQQRLAEAKRLLLDVRGQLCGPDQRAIDVLLASSDCADGEKAPAPSVNLPRRKVKTEFSTAEEDAQADAWNAALDAVQELNR